MIRPMVGGAQSPKLPGSPGGIPANLQGGGGLCALAHFLACLSQGPFRPLDTHSISQVPPGRGFAEEAQKQEGGCRGQHWAKH